MNKVRADEFLKYVAQILKENPNISFRCERDCKMIYRLLTKCGVKEEEKQINIKNEGMFKNWINYYSSALYTNAFVDYNWNYFCQFISEKQQASNDYIKIYVPTEHKSIQENVKIIFDYLDKERISHLSKVAQEIRFDNIVIRLSNENDARKVMDFLNNNKKIQSGLMEPNPFAFTHNNIPIVCDGGESYNTIIADYIGLYLQFKKNNNDLDNVSLNDFINFIKKYYYNKFIKKENLEDIPNHFFIGTEDELELSLPYRQINFKHITELIIESFQDNYTLDDFMNHFNKCNSMEQTNKEVRNLTTNRNQLILQKLLLESLTTMSEKYGKSQAIYQMSQYLDTGDPRYITRDNMLRNRVCSSNLRNDLNNELRTMNISLASYIDKISNKTLDYELLNQYFYITINKYGRDVAIINLINYIQNGLESNITRDNNLRNTIINSNFRDSLINYFKANNYRLEDLYKFFSNYLDNLESENKHTK